MFAPRLRPLWVLIVSGALGFRVGYVGFPTWQVAVQSAQVIAGVVTYPPDNPFYLYHVKLWTVLHQAAALGLLAGISEMRLSLWLSGLIGMMAFQAIALIVFAMSQRAWLAIGVAFLLVYTRAADHGGVVYPILLMGTEHTYGAMALSGFILVIGLLGSGALRTGGLLLGLAPAVHPSIGGWLWLVVLVATALGGSPWLPRARTAGPYFLAGVVVTMVSLLVQLLFIYEAPAVDPEVARSYLASFTTFWDGHRRPVDLARPGVALNLLALFLAATWLATRGRREKGTSAFVARVVVVSACVSLVAIVISWTPPERLPSWLVTMMPARLLNVNALLLPPFLIGIIGSHRGSAAGLLNAAVALALLTAHGSRLWDRTGAFGWLAWLGRYDPVVVLEVAVLVAVGLLVWVHRMPLERDGSPREPWTGAAWVFRGAVLAIVAIAAWGTWSIRASPRMVDYTNDSLFRVASEERAGVMVAAGAFHLPQMLARRPVLLNAGALDTLPYALESGPAMDRILKDVYAIDLRHPPPEVEPGLGRVPDPHNERTWEGFTRARWQEIRRAYDVRQVLTPPTYDLDLPIAAQSRDARLFVIPE